MYSQMQINYLLYNELEILKCTPDTKIIIKHRRIIDTCSIELEFQETNCNNNTIESRSQPKKTWNITKRRYSRC